MNRKIQETTVSNDGIVTGKPVRLRSELSGKTGVFHREKRNRNGRWAMSRFVKVKFEIRHDAITKDERPALIAYQKSLFVHVVYYKKERRTLNNSHNRRAAD